MEVAVTFTADTQRAMRQIAKAEAKVATLATKLNKIGTDVLRCLGCNKPFKVKRTIKNRNAVVRRCPDCKHNKRPHPGIGRGKSTNSIHRARLTV